MSEASTGTDETESRDGRAPLDREALAPLLAELDAAIQDADPVAVTACIGRIEQHTAGTGVDGEVHQLVAQTDHFAFDAAHRTLMQVADRLGISLV